MWKLKSLLLSLFLAKVSFLYPFSLSKANTSPEISQRPLPDRVFLHPVTSTNCGWYTRVPILQQGTKRNCQVNLTSLRSRNSLGITFVIDEIQHLFYIPSVNSKEFTINAQEWKVNTQKVLKINPTRYSTRRENTNVSHQGSGMCFIANLFIVCEWKPQGSRSQTDNYHFVALEVTATQE